MGELNGWFSERLQARAAPQSVDVIIQVNGLQNVPNVLQALPALGIRPSAKAFNFVQAIVPQMALADVAALSDVVRVSYNAPVWIRGSPFRNDPLLGRIALSEVEVPTNPVEAAAFVPFRLPLAVGAITQIFSFKGVPGGGPKRDDVIMVPTSETRPWVGVPDDDNEIRQTKVAVLDTGAGWPHPLFAPRQGVLALRSRTGEPPLDGLGHGTWCTTTAFGSSFQSRFGMLKGVAEAASGNLMHVKCLSNLGFGTTMWILQAMEDAVEWGARVISMSLGGPLQGSVTEDPQCVLIEQLKDRAIFIVAAGNSGPDEWTVGSPGAAPYALTVGAWSTYYNGPAIYSSRGPGGDWYKEHEGTWRRDYDIYGDRLIKPDCMAPGGGPVREGDKIDLIYSGVAGWMDGIYDLTPGDGLDGMRGTSMATPHVAGAVGWAVDRGIVSTVEEIRNRLADTAGAFVEGGVKSPISGYGLFHTRRLVPGG